MSDAPQQMETARTSEETVAITRRRSAATRRMTRKQTELRLEALEALPVALVPPSRPRNEQAD